MESIEYRIGKNCATSLLGIKPSNLVAFSSDEEINVKNVLENLKDDNIYFDILCVKKNRVLYIIYRYEILENHLKKSENYNFLIECDYPKNFNLKKYLKILKERFIKNACPHEVGIFLGYPIEDVRGFIKNPNNSIYSGYWKVYEKGMEKRILFKAYKKCTDNLCEKIFNGLSLKQIVENFSIQNLSQFN